ncbi:MAG: hypothetical protein K6T99_08225 [Armatimonadetes bacterium]|nr:hypothetical protein [Armatimonadota bacterium]
MDSELEKIDAIRSRLRVSYADARKALNEASGDVVAALAALEEKKKQDRADLIALGVEMADELQKITSGGPIRKLRIRYGDRTLTEMPVVLSAATAVAVGLAALLVSKLVIEVEKDQGEAAS